MSKDDQLYKDALETAAESKDVDTAEELLHFFVLNKKREYFAVCLFICYDLLRPDVVFELAWKNNLMDFAMPYMCQTMRDYMTKVDVLEKANEERSEKEAEAEKRGVGK